MINACGVTHPASGTDIQNTKKSSLNHTMAESRETDTEPEYDALLSEQEQEDSDFYSARKALLKPRHWWRTRAGILGAIILIISLSINGLFGNQHLTGGGIGHDDHMMKGHSKFAHLVAEVPMPWLAEDIFLDEDSKVADQAWDDINIDIGTIALDKSYAASMNLPEAQQFPWDESKSIYLLTGFHDLHCLKTIREWVAQIGRNETPAEPIEHMFHCLDALRQDIQCYADDTPRFTDESHLSGIGQIRQCRSWSKLEEWARARPACWRFTGSQLHMNMSVEDRYRFCPEDSPYAARVKEVFGDI